MTELPRTRVEFTYIFVLLHSNETVFTLKEMDTT